MHQDRLREIIPEAVPLWDMSSIRVDGSELSRLHDELTASLGLSTASGPTPPRGAALRKAADDPADLQHMRQQLAAIQSQTVHLHQLAEQIGKLPANYPWHINLIMRVISALLPWYTRPLRDFGKSCADHAEAVAGSLAAIAHRVDCLETTAKRIRTGALWP